MKKLLLASVEGTSKTILFENSCALTTVKLCDKSIKQTVFISLIMEMWRSSNFLQNTLYRFRALLISIDDRQQIMSIKHFQVSYQHLMVNKIKDLVLTSYVNACEVMDSGYMVSFQTTCCLV